MNKIINYIKSLIFKPKLSLEQYLNNLYESKFYICNNINKYLLIYNKNKYTSLCFKCNIKNTNKLPKHLIQIKYRRLDRQNNLPLNLKLLICDYTYTNLPPNILILLCAHSFDLFNLPRSLLYFKTYFNEEDIPVELINYKKYNNINKYLKIHYIRIKK